jgi:hypothetical protein
MSSVAPLQPRDVLCQNGMNKLKMRQVFQAMEAGAFDFEGVPPTTRKTKGAGAAKGSATRRHVIPVIIPSYFLSADLCRFGHCNVCLMVAALFGEPYPEHILLQQIERCRKKQ